MTVDHIIPLSAGGSDELDNLVYCCMRCNVNKGDFVATEEEMRVGKRLLNPLTDTFSGHLILEVETGELIPLTATGKFHIRILKLNRPSIENFIVCEQSYLLHCSIRCKICGKRLNI